MKLAITGGMNSVNEPILLPSVITIETVALLAEELKTKLAPGVVLVLDGSKTEVIGTPGIQLLLSLSKTLSDLGGKLTLISQPLFVSAFAALGLTSQLTSMEQQ